MIKHLFVILLVTFGSSQSQFVENWSEAESPIFITYATHGSAESAFSDPEASDGRSLQLRLNSGAPAGVGGAPATETLQRYKYGTYWTRAKTANCSNQPNAGVVSGIFTYFNDGGDRNSNGLPDNSELDFEWLCAKPGVVHLSIWTDYLEADPPRIRNVYRSVDITTGRVIMDCYRESFGECQELSLLERQPSQTVPLPSYDSSTGYYWYGLEYRADRVHFMMRDERNGNETISLWDYRGPVGRIPSDDVHFMHNTWHTNNWFPEDNDGSAVESPRTPVYMYVDYSSFTP